MDPLRPVRRAIQDAVRSRIGGANRDALEQRIWRAPGPRWHTPDDPIWRVHQDPAMFVGGLRALIMQSLHPLAMAGVDQHSGYRGDPWGRLQRTSLFIATTTYGRIDDAEAMLEAIRTVHTQVVGTDPAGRPYAASDPHLLGWVHAAECHSFLQAYRAYGATRLTRPEEDAYVTQMGAISERLGVIGAPTSAAALDGVLARYRPELESTTAARSTIAFVLDEPDLPAAALPAYRALAGAAIAITPPWAREMVGLDRHPRWRSAPTWGRFAGRAVTSTMRWAIDHPSKAGLPPLA
ncbi:oxygenase MpaB family protein [Janibacter sp. GXQ6167]|uniref:oxygenase MpaB family protein n=1 Tax=Janibacter sp. GXQ6167 TaxID=3240791 RepID=UPI0035255AA7